MITQPSKEITFLKKDIRALPFHNEIEWDYHDYKSIFRATTRYLESYSTGHLESSNGVALPCFAHDDDSDLFAGLVAAYIQDGGEILLDDLFTSTFSEFLMYPEITAEKLRIQIIDELHAELDPFFKKMANAIVEKNPGDLNYGND